ncbi:MAG: type I-G CRISPR-associated protein Cas8g2 [Phycisphaerae bacterium]
MNNSQPIIRVKVDPSNPGQFFACCGLLELADRLWGDCCGRFDDGTAFEIIGLPEGSSLLNLLETLTDVGLQGALTPDLAQERATLESKKRQFKRENKQLSDSEEKRRDYLGKLLRSGSMLIPAPFNLLLDWWQLDSDEVPKTWAGPMEVRRIANAALVECHTAFRQSDPFDYPCVLRPFDGDSDSVDQQTDESSKVEPFYFDSVRGSNAAPIDIGFSPNKLAMPRIMPTGGNRKAKMKQVKMETAAFPATEFFALIGLQRFRPVPTKRARIFEYTVWTIALPPSVAAAAACGLLYSEDGRRYEFENAFRTDQRKHKGFRPATFIGDTQ